MSRCVEISQMVIDCEKRTELMDDYEKSFIDNISKMVNWARKLSKKQEDKLEEIWNKVTEEG